jgi:hypothetical protein
MKPVSSNPCPEHFEVAGDRFRIACPDLQRAMSSAKPARIWSRSSHGMVGLDRSNCKRLQESVMPSDVSTQIDGDRPLQEVVYRGQPSDDGWRRRSVDSDLREGQVDSFGPGGLWMREPHDALGIDEKTRRLRPPGDPQQQLL